MEITFLSIFPLHPTRRIAGVMKKKVFLVYLRQSNFQEEKYSLFRLQLCSCLEGFLHSFINFVPFYVTSLLMISKQVIWLELEKLSFPWKRWAQHEFLFWLKTEHYFIFFSSLFSLGIMWKSSWGVCDILALCTTFGLLRNTGLWLSEENLSRSLWTEGLCRRWRVWLDGQNDGKYYLHDFNLVSELFTEDLHERFNEFSEGQTVYHELYIDLELFMLPLLVSCEREIGSTCWQMCPWVQIYSPLSCRKIVSFDDWLVKITFRLNENRSWSRISSLIELRQRNWIDSLTSSFDSLETGNHDWFVKTTTLFFLFNSISFKRHSMQSKFLQEWIMQSKCNARKTNDFQIE